MARTSLGAAEFALLVNNDQFRAEFVRSEALARSQSKKIADAIDQEMRRIEASGQKAGAGFTAGLRGAVALGAGAAGVTVGLATLHQALAGIVEITQQATQANFALRATYGQSAGTFSRFAQQQAAALKLSETGLINAAVAASTLSKNYAFTSEQIKVIIARSADLAAISGKDVADTTARVTAALRGEAEAAEVLGLTLNSDAVKGLANMTAEQRKNFESLDQVTKGQILYAELLRQSAFAEGAAVKRAGEAAGAFDRLGVAIENLGKALGQQLNPQLQTGAAVLAGLAEFAGTATTRLGELDQQAGDMPGLLRLAQLLGGPVIATAISAAAGLTGAAARGIRGGEAPGPILGPTPEEVAAGLEAGQEAAQRAKIALEQLRRHGDERIRIAKKVAAAALEAEQDVRRDAEKSRRAELDAAADAQAAELKLIDDQQRARIKANAADIDGAERAKDAAVRAAQDRHDAAVELIESESRALQRARELEDRARDQTRLQEDRDRSATRDFVDTTLTNRRAVEDRALDARRQAEDRALTDRRTTQDQAFDDERDAALESLKDQEEARSRSVDAEIQSIERRKVRALRALDQEADKARDSAQQRIRAIEAEATADLRGLDKRAEQARDTAEQRLRAIENSSDAALRALAEETEATRDQATLRLRAIDDGATAALRALAEEADAARDLADQQLRAIDDQQRAEDERHRQAMDNLAAEEAVQLGAIDERLRALDTAQRLAAEAQRDAELGAERARTGRGLEAALRVGNPAAIAAARKALAAADAAIEQERTRRRQDATRRELQEQAAAIRKEFDARKDALEAEDRARKESADAQQRQIRDTLAEQLDALEDRKQAIQDTADTEQQAIRDTLDQTLDALAQRKQAIEDTAAAEQRQIRDVLASTLDALDQRKLAVQDAAAAEQQQIQDSLAKHLDALDRRKLAVQDSTASEIASIRERDLAASDAYAAEVQRVNDGFELREQTRAADRLAEDRALEDSRAAEDLALAQSREAQDAALAAARLAEDQALADSRLAEDQALADGRAAQDEDLRLRRQASDDALKAERDAIDVAYNGPAGIPTLLRQATADINEEHRLQAESVRDKYDGPGGIKDTINATWDAVVQESQDATDDIERELRKQVDDWDTWRNDTVDRIQRVIDKINELIDRINAIPGGQGTGGGMALPPAAGPGMALPPAAGAGLAYGPVVKNATDDSYWTSAGTHGGHPAADIFAPAGSPIYAPVDGTLDSYSVPLGGNAATMLGADGRAYYFAHAQSPMASGSVRRGQQIGRVGNTGNAANTPPHLHFAISKSGPGTFDRFNGSGDVMGDASYWGNGGVGIGTGDGEWVDVKLFGRTYRIFTSGGGGVLGDVGAGTDVTVPGVVGRAIREALAAAGQPPHWEVAMGQIAAAESGQRNSNGSVVLGSGDFRAIGAPNPRTGISPLGLMQMMPGTFKGYRLAQLPDDIFDPVANPASASRYIGARYRSPAGTDYFKNGAFDWRGVEGYARGGPIPEPTWLVSQRTGLPYAEAGELGPEDVVPRRGRGGGGVTIQINAPIFGVDHLQAEMDRAYDRNERRKRHERSLRTR